MKKPLWVIIGVIFMLPASCATAGNGNLVFEGDGLSLAEAIEQSAEKIAADLPDGSRVAIVAWESPSAGMSDYIMEELTGALVDRSMEVADRQNLEYVHRELNLQMSGEVSDESARSIGKFLGADLVITGQLTELGGPYRYRANAIHVEYATRDSSTRLDVRGDSALRRMATALASQKGVAIKTASYGEDNKPMPQTAGTFLDRGILFAIRGDYEMAIEDFTEALTLKPNLSAAYLLRGRAFFASASYIITVEENFSSVGIISKSGSITFSQGQAYDKAIADYTEAIRLDPNSSIAYEERGNAYGGKKDYDRAIADFTQAIRLDPNNTSAYNNRGLAYGDKGDYDRAIADFTQTIRLDPNNASAYNNRGGVYSYKGDYTQAITDYTRAIQLAPNFAIVYKNRGTMYFNKGDYTRAITDYTRAIRLDPNNVDAYIDRGDAYWIKGNRTRAYADWSKALQLDPNNTEARDNLENYF
jgi:tetratricopeptide (TPR) repeat protein